MTEPKLEKGGEAREDGKVNRLYYKAVFMDAENPFLPRRSRMVWQDYVDFEKGDKVEWKAGDPAVVSKMIGKNIPGHIECFNVEPYTIGENTVDTYTTVILRGESSARVLKQNGYTLAEIHAQYEEQEVDAPMGSDSLN